ncbi:hypothetical protein SDC9_146659 [bioreactor metagenome]|uniref:Uncharacterized protein n=1 Tax=bioreactor metagenome TaxID=1076179 RepID=A0A645EEB6_9ZZZZ
MVCPICGKAFAATSNNSKFCGPACKLENGRRYAREYERQARADGRCNPLNLKRPTYSIQEIGRAAQAAGMSYGDYVAKVGL